MPVCGPIDARVTVKLVARRRRLTDLSARFAVRADLQCANKPQTGWRRRRRVGSERNIEEGEKTDTSEIHINVQSSGNDGLTGVSFCK